MMNMIDSYRHKGLRKKLVEIIKQKGITDQNVLKAIETIPRHFFLNSSFLDFAYQDKPFPIGSGQTISQPFTVAFQTQLLNIKKGDLVMEIGTGSGYQASVFLEMGAKVYTIERQKKLYDKTKKILPSIGYSPKMFYGDGYKGLPTYAPFDKIIITAAAPEIPQVLLEQLKVGGLLVIPVGDGDTQEMKMVERTETEYKISEHGLFSFVPMLGNKAND